MPRVHWILFDAVGTLLVPVPTVAEAYQQAGRRFACEIEQDVVQRRFTEAYRAQFGGSEGATSEALERERWQAVVGQVFPEASDPAALFATLWEHFAQPTSWKLTPFARPVLGALLAHGYEIGIASNFDGRLRAICAGHKLSNASERLFISSELGFRKPDPRFYATIGERLSGEPEIMLVGDDRENDYDAARTAGWQALLLADEQAEDLPAADQLRDLRELLNRLPPQGI